MHTGGSCNAAKLGVVAAIAALLVCSTAAQVQRRDRTTSKGGRKTVTTPVEIPEGRDVATLAGGCFWCTEAVFKDLKGIEKVTPGYAGGHVANPTYEQVCTGTTGHAEAVQIVFDPKIISYADILRIFFATHDPTTLNRQGPDVGEQYRSAIFTHSEAQAQTAREVIAEIERLKLYSDPIRTEVTSFTSFYPAEDHHRDFFARHPEQAYCKAVIAPKIVKFREKYRDWLRTTP